MGWERQCTPRQREGDEMSAPAMPAAQLRHAASTGASGVTDVTEENTRNGLFPVGLRRKWHIEWLGWERDLASGGREAVGQEVQHCPEPAVGRLCGQVTLGLSGTWEKTKMASFRGREAQLPAVSPHKAAFPHGQNRLTKRALGKAGSPSPCSAAPAPGMQPAKEIWGSRQGAAAQTQSLQISAKLRGNWRPSRGQTGPAFVWGEMLRDAALIPRGVRSSWGVLAQPKLPLWGGGTGQFAHAVLPSPLWEASPHLQTQRACCRLEQT